ncbi:MAG: hypothetical protein QME35_02985 [Thermoanaerobacteraceae bacterium]|nr:hypothetical protein [Thermoanaerobacteraceae bacterium]
MKENLLQQTLMRCKKILNKFRYTGYSKYILITSFLFAAAAVVFEPKIVYADVLSKAFAIPFNALSDAFKFLGLSDKGLYDLVFNTNPGGDYSWHAPFLNAEWDTMLSWYKVISSAVFGLCAVSFGLLGFKMMKAGANPGTKAECMKKIEHILLAVLLLIFMPELFKLVIYLNNGLVDLFKSLATNVKTAIDLSPDKFLSKIGGKNELVQALIRLGFLGLTVYFNILYIIRKYVIITMVVISPILVWSWSISGHFEGLGTVLGEIVSNQFMQASHALCICIFGIMCHAKNQAWWVPFVLMVAIIPTSKVIRDLFLGFLKYLGANEELYAGMATGGLAGLAVLARGVSGTASKIPNIGTCHELAVSQDFSQNGGNSYGDGGGFSDYTGKVSRAAGIGGKIAGGFGKVVGAVGLGAMGLTFGGGAATSLARIGSNLGGRLGSSAGAMSGALLGTGIETMKYGYIGSNPDQEYTDSSGSGLIKGYKDEEGNSRYILPTQKGYDDVIAAETFATERQAAESGYRPGKYGDIIYSGNPEQKYITDSGSGAIKGYIDDDGNKRYILPDQEGYDDVTPTALFTTEKEAHNLHGYEARHTSDSPRIVTKFIGATNSETVSEATAKTAGAVSGSISGPNGVPKGIEKTKKAYDFLRDPKTSIDKWRWS